MPSLMLEPLEELRNFQQEIDRLFEGIFTGRPTRELAPLRMEWAPPVEMFETENELVLKAALPNIDPKLVEITVTNDAITLKGETKHEEEHKGRNYYRREFKYGAFMRYLPLLTEVKGAEAKATYKDGVLAVRMPKTEHAKTTSVKVNVEV